MSLCRCSGWLRSKCWAFIQAGRPAKSISRKYFRGITGDIVLPVLSRKSPLAFDDLRGERRWRHNQHYVLDTVAAGDGVLDLCPPLPSADVLEVVPYGEARCNKSSRSSRAISRSTREYEMNTRERRDHCVLNRQCAPNREDVEILY